MKPIVGGVHIARMCDLSTFACWMVYAPFIGARSR